MDGAAVGRSSRTETSAPAIWEKQNSRTLILSDLGTAFRLSRHRHDGALLVLAYQTLRQEGICHVRDSGNVLPMIFPNATRSGTGTRRELVDAAPVGVYNSTLRGI